MVFQLILEGNRFKNIEKTKKSKIENLLHVTNLVNLPETQNEIRIAKTERLLSKKLFWNSEKNDFFSNSKFRSNPGKLDFSGQFLIKNLGNRYDFFCFFFFGIFHFSSTFGYHNFFFTEPIFKNLYILKSIWSESFISAILEA